ncbi:helix-turn-helix transcriptional regulator [Lentzea kentuckyensis]|uniref:helix-turn-helix transcriptional regulator n=1 Tax=Lentzea kentuckyensis TaxID=360086 RepID=UPI001302AA6C|nr:AAA family ATPase [Lentzea kentuckyensis]
MTLSKHDGHLSTGQPVGRRRELRQVLAGVKDAGCGRPGLLHLRGPRGIGKSATIELLRHELRDIADVLVTTCEGQTDFAVASDLLGAAVVDAVAAGRDEYARLYAMNDLIVGLTTDRPLVLVLDDAHRCDRATARWLGVLARRLPRPRVYVVLAYPCAERVAAEERFTELTGALDTTTIDLGPLAEADVTELITRECGFIPDREIVLACLESAAGLPGVTLSWVETLKALGSVPDIESESVTWHLTWIEGEQETTRRYVVAVAVLGSAEPSSAAVLAELPAAAAEAKRVELQLLGILDDSGRFRSAVLRERLLATLDPDELTALRTKAARLLTDEGRPQEEVAELVMMLPALTEVWMFCALRGAARDGALGPDRAISCLRRVLEAVPGHVDTRLELATHLTEVDPSAAMDVYAELLDDVTDPEVRASVAIHCGDVALRAGRGPEAFRLLAGRLDGRPWEIDPELRAQTEAVTLINGFSAPATVGAAMALARTISPPQDRAVGYRRLVLQLARAEVLRGDSLPTALSHVRSALPAPGGCRDLWDVHTVVSLHFCGERADAMALASEIIDAAAARDDVRTLKIALATRAGLAYEAGDLVGAERDAHAALALPSPEHESPALTVLALALVRRGDNDQVEQLFHRMHTPGDPIEYGWALNAKAHWLWNCGDGDAALDVLQRCGREFEAMGVHNPVLVPWWVHAVSISVQLGRTAEAAAFAEQGAETALRWDTPVARGYALLAQGLSKAHAETLEQAVAELGEAGSQLHQAQALRALGQVLMRAEHDKEARKHLRAAVDIAVRCGASVAADQAHELLVAAGGRMSAVSASPQDALTTGERRVALLAANGLTNREIAEKLHVTVRTVENHLSNAYRKLGAHTRAELAVQLR